MIKQLGGSRDGRCIDIEGERVEPGGNLQVFPCFNKWHQMFTFGDGVHARNATILASVPSHIINTLKYKGKDQHPHICVGVIGRSQTEYSPWKEDENKERLDSVDFLPKKVKPKKGETNVDTMAKEGSKLKSLRLWKFKQLVTIPCSDEDAIIDFVFVPFIVEEDDKEDSVAPVEDERTNKQNFDIATEESKESIVAKSDKGEEL